jgi:hypothetical protein
MDVICRLVPVRPAVSAWPRGLTPPMEDASWRMVSTLIRKSSNCWPTPRRRKQNKLPQSGNHPAGLASIMEPRPTPAVKRGASCLCASYDGMNIHNGAFGAPVTPLVPLVPWSLPGCPRRAINSPSRPPLTQKPQTTHPPRAFLRYHDFNCHRFRRGKRRAWRSRGPET